MIPAAAFWSAWFLGSLSLAAVLTSRLIGWTRDRGVVDTPNARSSHARVTPRGGGIAIVAVSAGAAALTAALRPDTARSVAGMMLPALAIAVVSWIDDVRSVPNRIRFGVHLGAAIAAVAALGPLSRADFGSLGACSLAAAAWPLTILWIVGLTNAFNFMDGIDGIAGITAVAAAAALAAAAGLVGAPAVLGSALALAAGSLGFLSCNWPPARIFMGDVGSAFCGFLIAVLPLAAGRDQAPILARVAVCAMWPFIFDTAFTLLRRVRRGENVFQAHRSHLYQRLVIAGWPHRSVSILYGILAAAGAAIAVVTLVHRAAGPAADVAAAGLFLGAAVLLLALVTTAEAVTAP